MDHHDNSSEKYITSKKVRDQYGVCNSTLKRWANEGKIKTIRTVGNKRLYGCDDIASIFGIQSVEKKKRSICYARVSSQKQKGDLERQVEDLRRDYPSHEIIQDIGSGINFERKGFKTLVDQIMSGNIEEVVISHRDRLVRFGYALLEQICQKFECRLVVQSKDVNSDPTNDLAEDLLSIVTVFTAKHHGLRASEKKRKRKEAINDRVESNKKSKTTGQGINQEGTGREMSEDTTLSL